MQRAISQADGYQANAGRVTALWQASAEFLRGLLQSQRVTELLASEIGFLAKFDGSIGTGFRCRACYDLLDPTSMGILRREIERRDIGLRVAGNCVVEFADNRWTIKTAALSAPHPAQDLGARFIVGHDPTMFGGIRCILRGRRGNLLRVEFLIVVGP
jgi:hypothetical protein